MNDQSFEDAANRLCDQYPDYDVEAYWFVWEGLAHTSRALERDKAPDHHVTGRELAEGLRDYALSEFGPLALLTLSQWGIGETADFGKIVMRLVSEGVLSKKSTDKLSDFDNVYSFEEAFDKPFLPFEEK